MAVRELAIPGIVIGGEIGRSAKGVDYRAQYGERPCLLRLAPECHSAGGAERDQIFRAFRSEVIALARARHPVIPAVLEMGAVDERPYAVLELPAGETLADRLRWGPLPERSIVALGQRLLGGLREAHRRGLVHGHLTPAEIVFTEGHRDMRIVGFGSPLDTSVTRDFRGDLRALGRVLYECACGRAAFAGVTEDRRGELTELPELSRGNEPVTSPELSAVVARLLRLESAGADVDLDALLEDLERLPAGAPSRPKPHPLPDSLCSGGPEEVSFVGRSRELETLRDAWDDVRLGRSAIVNLRGAPGSGKSRLLRAFVQRAATEPQVVLAARCIPGDARPFAALGSLLNGSARWAHNGEAERRELTYRDAGQEMAPLLKHLSPELARLFGEVAEFGAVHEMQSLFAEGAAEFLTRFLKSAGHALVVIDDLQWMDAGSRTVLTRVADRARHSKTLFLVTSRTDDANATDVEAFFRPIRALKRFDFTLRPLAADECRDLVGDYLGSAGISEDIVEPLNSLGDGTPLSILEVLHAIGGEGLLKPAWGTWRLDRDGLERIKFPAHTREILARRVAGLSPNALRVMETAAVFGLSFKEGFVARIVEGADCAAALHEARSARVLAAATGPAGTARFVHETVREVLLARLNAVELRGIHQRIAEALDADGAADTPSICRRAAEYAAGDWTRAAKRVFATNYEAGLRTFASFDNDRALTFLTVAERAAAEAKIDPDAEFYQTLGEVYVRRGALSKAREYFLLALERAREPLERGILHSRIAWVDYTKGDTEVSWLELNKAFGALSQKMPTGKPLELAREIVSTRTVRRELKLIRPAKALPEEERRRIEALCGFHYQAARLAIESDKPAQFVANVLRGIEEAERLGPSRALVRTLLVYGFAQVALGFRGPGLKRIDEAERMAEAIRDPVVSAYCLQMRSVVMGWAGNLDAALDAASRLLLEHGHWLELSEYCLLCWNQSLMLGIRGQAEEAWQWLERGIEKVRHENHETEMGAFLECGARATLGTLGREADLRLYFDGVDFPSPQLLRGPHYRFAFGSRLRALTESGEIGAEFETLVREVRSTIPDPARAHLSLSEFYVHVAHARVHQWLRSDESARVTLLHELSISLRELRAIARVPVLTAHLWAVEGYQAAFKGSFLQSALAFSRADDLAQRENCPWVLFAVARGRAHLHKMQGRDAASLDQATLAATIAQAHGYSHRLRWIRDEFPGLVTVLAPQRTPASEDDGDSAAISRRVIDSAQPSDSDLTEQTKRIVDELVDCVRAERGTLLLAPEEGGAPTLVAGRDALHHDFELSTTYRDDLVRRAFESGRVLSEHLDELSAEGDRGRSAIALPLVSRERVVGVVCLESSRRQFSIEEERVLEILANQAAVAIELTRALRARTEELRERKLLEDELRQAQKMEAIGRLAGTIAHDFNNLLTIISGTVDSTQREHGEVLRQELADIREACSRGAALTGQLLTFSRRQASAPQLVRLNELLWSWTPLIRRLLPENIEVVTRLESERDAILADPNRLEQVLLNLAANARDAMPSGGRVTIATRDAYPLGADQGRGEQAQDHVVFTVEDTGEGMEPDVLRQAFEPFFTTKPRGKGTGLGLSIVYGTVRQMHGRITVDSAPGQGTVFHMYFPRAKVSAETGVAPTALESAQSQLGPLRSQTARRPDTILLVDDERLILTALERGLVREGYRVITALTGEAAIELIKHAAPGIDVIVTDVLMPGMSGPQLVEQLDAMGVRPPHLFISGFTDGAVVPEHLLKGGGLLVKPFTIHELLNRIRPMLEGSASAVECSEGS